ncbi:MAG: hypothetical protein WBL74_03145 [Novosphingobium sp.]|uniref:hypothetical protein n=1 Tax=Novosphingobium sp. TaxID=1874826 RepID=UPI003C79A8D5
MAEKMELSFWFEGGENHAQFSAIVAANGFSGETGYVTYPSHWREFLDGIGHYPITDTIALTIGEEFEDGPLLTLAIGPEDRRGGLRVHVSLAANQDRSRKVSTDFGCVYSDVIRFAGEAEIGLRMGGTAVLAPDPN